MRAECLTVTVEPDLSPVGRKAGSPALTTITYNQPSKPDLHSETGSRDGLRVTQMIDTHIEKRAVVTDGGAPAASA